MEEAELLFADNVRYNSSLAARNGKHHGKHIWRLGEVKLKSEEVLARLCERGVHVSLMTLSRYSKNKLLPEPKIVNLGRKGGRLKDWPDETPSHLFAAIKMINGQVDESGFKIGTLGVVKAREEALKAIEEHADKVYEIPTMIWISLICKYYGDDINHREVAFYNDYREEAQIIAHFVIETIEKYGSQEWKELLKQSRAKNLINHVDPM